MKNDSWLEILVHEVGHLEQMVENIDLWDKCSFNPWSMRRKTPFYEELFKNYCKLEIDCDKRALENIGKYNLPVDVADYCRSSNCYHASYYYFFNLQCFYNPRHKVCDDEKIKRRFPDNKINPFAKAWKERKFLSDFLEKNHTKL